MDAALKRAGLATNRDSGRIISFLPLVAPSPALLVQQPRNLVRAGLAHARETWWAHTGTRNSSTAARMAMGNNSAAVKDNSGGADDDKPPMRQVAVASYAVGTHTAAGRRERMDKRLHSQDRQACLVLTLESSPTSSLQESCLTCLACTSFPSRGRRGWKRVPTVPMIKAIRDGYRNLPAREETTTRRMGLPGRPHLISLSLS